MIAYGLGVLEPDEIFAVKNIDLTEYNIPDKDIFWLKQQFKKMNTGRGELDI